MYFSPHGGATIAKVLVDASKRGVKVLAVLDKSNETEQYSAATFLVHAGSQTLIDDQHAIAHNKVYRVPGCKGDAGMHPASVVPFATEAEAQQAEYHKAKNCP